jgi:hypothetical protein
MAYINRSNSDEELVPASRSIKKFDGNTIAGWNRHKELLDSVFSSSKISHITRKDAYNSFTRKPPQIPKMIDMFSGEDITLECVKTINPNSQFSDNIMICNAANGLHEDTQSSIIELPSERDIQLALADISTENWVAIAVEWRRRQDNELRKRLGRLMNTFYKLRDDMLREESLAAVDMSFDTIPTSTPFSKPRTTIKSTGVNDPSAAKAKEKDSLSKKLTVKKGAATRSKTNVDEPDADMAREKVPLSHKPLKTGTTSFR